MTHTCPRCGATLGDDDYHPIGMCGRDDEPGRIYCDGDGLTAEQRAEAIRQYQAEWVAGLVADNERFDARVEALRLQK